MSLKTAIESADDLGHEDVEVPEWGLTVRVSSVSLAKRDDLIAAFAKRGEDATLTDSSAEVLAATLRDPETNELVFDSVEEAATILKGRDSRVVDRLMGVANVVCGFDSAPTDQVEGAKKSPSAE